MLVSRRCRRIETDDLLCSKLFHLKLASISGQNNEQMAILNDHNLIWILVRYEAKTNEFRCCALDSRAHCIYTPVPLSSRLPEMPRPGSPGGREQMIPGSLSALSGCQMPFERYKFQNCPQPLLFFTSLSYPVSSHSCLSFRPLFKESLV